MKNLVLSLALMILCSSCATHKLAKSCQAKMLVAEVRGAGGDLGDATAFIGIEPVNLWTALSNAPRWDVAWALTKDAISGAVAVGAGYYIYDEWIDGGSSGGKGPSSGAPPPNTFEFYNSKATFQDVSQNSFNSHSFKAVDSDLTFDYERESGSNE